MRRQCVCWGLAVSILGASVVGCESNAGTGAIIGGAGGAAAGGLIGSMSHARAGEGALIGGAIGAIGGALVGHGMDESDKKKAEENEYADRSSYQKRERHDMNHPEHPAVRPQRAKHNRETGQVHKHGHYDHKGC
jgi:hypothetical protein